MSPANTPQRQRSTASANGRNAILSSAMRNSIAVSLAALGKPSNSLIRWRYSGVTDSAIASPIASWKPSFAPFWNR